MYNNKLKKYKVFLVFLFAVILISVSIPNVSAASTLSVSRVVEKNKATFTVRDSENSNDEISILIIKKGANCIVYMDQATLVNGEHVFETLLPKGEYTGYVNFSSDDKVGMQDISIVNDEFIVTYKPLAPIRVAKGETPVLPGSVIAIFDSGANREVCVEWTEVPDTDIPGQYALTGKVKGSTETVELLLNIE